MANGNSRIEWIGPAATGDVGMRMTLPAGGAGAAAREPPASRRGLLRLSGDQEAAGRAEHGAGQGERQRAFRQGGLAVVIMRCFLSESH